jgi:hypothetical protein
MNNFLLLVLFLLFVGAMPMWPHSMNWGYYPGSGLGFILILAVFFAMMRPAGNR